MFALHYITLHLIAFIPRCIAVGTLSFNALHCKCITCSHDILPGTATTFATTLAFAIATKVTVAATATIIT